MNLSWTSCLLIILGGTTCMPRADAADAAEPPKPGITTLANRSVKYTASDQPWLVLKRADVEAIVVDNRAVEDPVLPGHRAGYSGIASLKHTKRPQNLFVPAYAGLNFEHIHDGTAQSRETLFEPRQAPMELRRIGPHTAELYQKPTPHWGLESCHRYHLLEDGTIELTFECIPRKAAFRNGYIGLFWASYIHRPESGDIHFRGLADGEQQVGWVRAVSPSHGVQATHVAVDDRREFAHDPQFPLTLVFNRSKWRCAESWYYGVSHGMALVQAFRPGDGIRISQSPSGGGRGNPAWDFQWFIPQYEVGKLYRFVMRVQYVPAESPEAMRETVQRHLDALGGIQ